MEVVPDRPAPGSPSYDESHEAVWDVVCSLPPRAAHRRRAALPRTADRGRDRRPDGHAPSSTVTSQSSTRSPRCGGAARPPCAHRRARAPRPADPDPDARSPRPPTTRHLAVDGRRPLARARPRAPPCDRPRGAPRRWWSSEARRWSCWTGATRDAAPGRTTSTLRRSLPDLPQGQAPQVAFLEGDAFVTARRRAGHRAGLPHGHDRGHLRRRRPRRPAPRRRSGPFATLSLVSGGSTQPPRLRDPGLRPGERRPGVLALRRLPVPRPGPAVPRDDDHADDEGRDLLPGREHEQRRGGRRHRRAPAGRRIGRADPDRPGRLAQPDPPRGAVEAVSPSGALAVGIDHARQRRA